MTEAGLKKIDVYIETGKVKWENEETKEDPRKKEFQVPDFILNAFAKNEPALTNFNNIARSHQRNYVLWITDAKREETIIKRLNESIKLLKENRNLGLK